ncbi:unnamed protein product, partial [Callosobruchus maculatus]
MSCLVIPEFRIGYRLKSDIPYAHRYIREVLEPHGVPHAQVVG